MKRRNKLKRRLATQQKKEADARIVLSKAKTECSIRSKQRALDSASKNVVNAQKAYSAAEVDYSKKEKAVTEAQKKLQ